MPPKHSQCHFFAITYRLSLILYLHHQDHINVLHTPLSDPDLLQSQQLFCPFSATWWSALYLGSVLPPIITVHSHIASSNYGNTTNCYVLRTPAILSDIRISRSLRSAFTRMSERVIIPYSHSCASTSWLMVCDPGITWSQISSTGLTGAGCQEVPARPSYQ